MRVRVINHVDLASHEYLKGEVRDVSPRLVEESPWCFEVLPGAVTHAARGSLEVRITVDFSFKRPDLGTDQNLSCMLYNCMGYRPRT